MDDQKYYDPTINDDILCMCGRRYKDHFYYERGSTRWYWAWSYINGCKEFREISQKSEVN
jgi:hypothetical protein